MTDSTLESPYYRIGNAYKSKLCGRFFTCSLKDGNLTIIEKIYFKTSEVPL